jgi:peptide deformylase
MAVRDVLRLPHPSLKHVCPPLTPEDAGRVERVAADLVDTMRASPHCVGLAAPQIDELVRMIVVDVTGHRRTTTCHGLLVLVNPRVVRASGAEVGREGCLSVPELTANVRRATEIAVEALTPAGAEMAIETAGFEARALQHEIDHLDGVLFLDRVASLKTDIFPRKRRESG